jgi:hypothetical protein
MKPICCTGISVLGSAEPKDIERLPGFSGSRIELWRTRVHASIVAKIHQLYPTSQASLYGHHGSRRRMIAAATRRAPIGHPRRELLAGLQHAEVTTYRTDEGHRAPRSSAESSPCRDGLARLPRRGKPVST